MSKYLFHVGVMFGSDSDLPKGEIIRKILEDFKVPFAATICSAHRTPERTVQVTKEWEDRGCKVIIALASKSAHLPGAIASQTFIPVIGVPLTNNDDSAVNGLDALLSIAQMPEGVPVAMVGVNASANAALFAIRMLATENKSLMTMLIKYQEDLKQKTINKQTCLQQAGWPE